MSAAPRRPRPVPVDDVSPDAAATQGNLDTRLAEIRPKAAFVVHRLAADQVRIHQFHPSGGSHVTVFDLPMTWTDHPAPPQPTGRAGLRVVGAGPAETRSTVIYFASVEQIAVLKREIAAESYVAPKP